MANLKEKTTNSEDNAVRLVGKLQTKVSESKYTVKERKTLLIF